MTSDNKNTVERLYKEFSKDLQNFVQFRIGSAQDSHDIVQDVFYRLSRSEGKIGEISDPQGQKAYLFSVANNLITDRFRKNAIRARHAATSNDQALEEAKTELGPERHVIAQIDIALVKSVLQKLPEDARRAFVMNRFQYRTYNEIGEELGLNVKMVEKLIVKALNALRAALNEPNGGTHQGARK